MHRTKRDMIGFNYIYYAYLHSIFGDFPVGHGGWIPGEMGSAGSKVACGQILHWGTGGGGQGPVGNSGSNLAGLPAPSHYPDTNLNRNNSVDFVIRHILITTK